jgi:hypothetical protein
VVVGDCWEYSSICIDKFLIVTCEIPMGLRQFSVFGCIGQVKLHAGRHIVIFVGEYLVYCVICVWFRCSSFGGDRTASCG